MNKDELWQILLANAEYNPEYQQAFQKLQGVEKEYMAFFDTLPADQKELLERYIAACEEMDEALVFAAYQLGLLHARLS